MNIDNLIKELEQINVEKLIDDELVELAETLQISAKKICNETIKRYVKNGGEIF